MYCADGVRWGLPWDSVAVVVVVTCVELCWRVELVCDKGHTMRMGSGCGCGCLLWISWAEERQRGRLSFFI